MMDVQTSQFFPSGAVVLSGGMDMRLKIWSVQDGSCPRTLCGHCGGVCMCVCEGESDGFHSESMKSLKALCTHTVNLSLSDERI